ncbi:MAG: superinfection immunity protein [Planctomycetaceae bacterium]
MNPQEIIDKLVALTLVEKALLATIYFLPTVIAVKRGRRNALAIFLVNLFFGATLVGWGIALVWSVMAVPIIRRDPEETVDLYKTSSNRMIYFGLILVHAILIILMIYHSVRYFGFGANELGYVPVELLWLIVFSFLRADVSDYNFKCRYCGQELKASCDYLTDKTFKQCLKCGGMHTILWRDT